MSGICGVLRLDGADADVSEVGAMTAAMAHRGPDSTRHWAGGSAALGHALLSTTPEAAVERLPLVDPASGCVITADARLDNRDDLIAALGLDAAGRTIGDGELILAAYLRWGEDCAARLLGDFAFAIWDPRARSLFAARDQMGMRQLHYHHHAGRLFAYGTEAEAVLAAPGVPRRINETRIVDFLDNGEGADLSSTWFEAVYRLPPAHWLRVEGNRLAIRRYWRLDPPEPLVLPSDEAYADAFLHVFSTAVRSRLRAPSKVAAMLSGGLDSGSVAATAAEILAQEGAARLVTYSAIGDEPSRDIESRSIRASATALPVDAHFIPLGRLDALAGELSILTRESDPFDAHMALIRAVYLTARKDGVRVMLDGAAGDTTTSSGNLISLLIRRGRFGQALAEARGEVRFYGWPVRVAPIFARAGWAALAPAHLRRLRRWLLRRRQVETHDLIARDVLSRHDLAARRSMPWEHDYRDRPYDPAHRARIVTHNYVVAGRERYDRVAARIGIEPRDPYMDVRLIRFLLSLPPQQLQREGFPKWVLRNAMAAHLPDSVRWRRGTDHLGPDFIAALVGLCPEVARPRAFPLEPFLNDAALAIYADVSSTAMDSAQRIALTSLSAWIESDLAGVAPSVGSGDL